MTKRKPTPRPDILDIYWRFASERHRVFERRVAGEASPWTSDEILATYKFCSVFRAADRVSQYLIHDVAYDEGEYSEADRLFQIVAFRTFSKVETWRGLRAVLGRQPTLADLRSGRFRRALDTVRDVNGGLYTSAFILCALDAYGQPFKHHNHVELFKDMFLRHNLAGDIARSKTLKAVNDLLQAFPLMGDFMSYQTAIDLNYSPLLAFSENDFTKPGPGALRGLKKVFINLGEYTPDDVIQWMVDTQEAEFDRRGLPRASLWGRPLHAIDCQGLFCETDKYCRVAKPELASSRSKIKKKFERSVEAVRLFFPPKWGINQRLPTEPVLGVSAWAQQRTAAPKRIGTTRDPELSLGL